MKRKHESNEVDTSDDDFESSDPDESLDDKENDCAQIYDITISRIDESSDIDGDDGEDEQRNDESDNGIKKVDEEGYNNALQ